MSELRLSEIWIYPVKGMGGIRLKESVVQEKGLKYDRRMMLVDENNRFMTQRNSYQLALFKQSIANGVINVKWGDDVLEINSAATGEPFEAVIWDDTVFVTEINQTYSQWFSDKLGMRCKLVSFPENNSRPVRRHINNENVSLADGYPFLILGQGSLDYLNSKLESALPMNRFRPNFVFTGGQPNVEDTWREFSIGENRFVGIKPCARCLVTTINQQTAEKGIEPLKTLAKYRRHENEVYFGQNVIAVDHGVVREGDQIVVSSFMENLIAPK